MKKTVIGCMMMAGIANSAISQDIDEVKDLISNERYGSAEIILEKEIASATLPEANYLLLKTYLEQD